jgi:LPXTG-motif cell wall-anchored protein
VLGSQVVRSLPRTGSSSQTLAMVGGMLVLLGAVMTLGSRRKLALEQ